MLSERMQRALNEQINRELFSSYIYLAMATHFEEKSLDGFAQWMYGQSQEEYGHAMRILRHVLERGGHVELGAIEAPPAEFGSPLEIFRQALDHERKITGHIHDIYRLAVEERDYAAQSLMEWFVNEQVEEEDTVGRIVDQLDLAGDDRAAILLLDKELGQRPQGGESAPSAP